MIVYFSGTGNSAYVAKRLQRELQDEGFDLFSSIRQRKKDTLYAKQPWVIVAPTYAQGRIYLYFMSVHNGLLSLTFFNHYNKLLQNCSIRKETRYQRNYTQNRKRPTLRISIFRTPASKASHDNRMLVFCLTSFSNRNIAVLQLCYTQNGIQYRKLRIY